MRVLFVRSLIGLLALVFGASGVAATYCGAAHNPIGGKAAAQLAQVQSVQTQSAGANNSQHMHHADRAPHAYVAQHGDDGLDRQLVSDGAEPAGMDIAACSKCCGICTLVNAVVPPVTGHAVFKVTTAEFAARPDLRSGTPLRVDPGIPKHIV